jgi:hypothetical protein
LMRVVGQRGWWNDCRFCGAPLGEWSMIRSFHLSCAPVLLQRTNPKSGI